MDRRQARSSTINSRPSTTSPTAAELQALLQNVSETTANSTRPISSSSLHLLCNDLRRIRQLLIDDKDRPQARSAFRHVAGFNVIIDVLRAFSGFYDSAKLSRDEKIDFFELVRSDLDVLSEALNEHQGNRRFFATRIQHGGWKALEQTLAATGFASALSDADGQEYFFGQLLAFALADEHFANFFRGIEKTREKSNSNGENGHGPQSQEHETGSNGTAVDTKGIRGRLELQFGGNEVLRNPEIIPVILSFWHMLVLGQDSPPKLSILPVAIITALDLIANLSVRNAVGIHGTQVITTLLPILFEKSASGQTLAPASKTIVHDLARTLIPYGINRLDDACQLFRLASTSEEAGKFLLYALKNRSPAFIQFDLSLHGFSCVELPSLGRTFPPQSSSQGYTLTAWIRIDRFDPEVHTTIFGAYDSTQTSFVLAYLEKDSGHFILQTSVKSARPSVRFKSAQFKEGIWYHIALVHRRPRATSLSAAKASLFVNGNFVEQIKCPYPSSPPTSHNSTDSFASLSSHTGNKSSTIECFLGTTQALALRLGRNVVSTKWSLSSFHLFQDALSDDMIAVHHRLGMRYTGNFQDLLGSFQTYRDSAELNRHNELMHPGLDEKSEIAAACRQKAGILMPEARVLLSFSPGEVLDNDDRNHINESRLSKAISKDASRMLQRLIRAGGNAVMLNSAVPAINDALTQPSGVAVLAGDPVVVVPQAIDDTCWRIAGSAAVGLKLVELARTKDDVLRAIEIFFQTLEGSWRNSEAVERDGYQVLAGLLREKLGFSSIFADAGTTRAHAGPVDFNEREELALESLRMILRFVGYEEENPAESLLINPLAYRVLLVDFDTWRKTPIATQKLYYSQFMHFSANNRNRVFNSKRLIRMRIVKRMLDALKGESFSADVFPDFLEAFSALLKGSTSRDNLRALALFITYAIQENRAFPYRSNRGNKSNRNSFGNTPLAQLSVAATPRSNSPGQPSKAANDLSRHEVGVLVLEMFTEILCDPTSDDSINKFTKTVASKWLMFLLDETDPRILFYTTKILVHMLITHGPIYVKRFSEVHHGFTVLRYRLKTWWYMPAIWTLGFALLFGISPATISFEEDFNLFALADIFSRKTVKVTYPEAFSVLTGMLEHGLRAIVQEGYASSSQPENSNGSRSSQRSGSNGEHATMAKERSLSLHVDTNSRFGAKTTIQVIAHNAEVLNTVIRFLADLHMKWASFRDFAITSTYVQDLLFVLYPIIVTSDSVSAETELNSRGSALTFEGQDVVIRPHVLAENMRPPIVRTTTVEPPPSPSMQRAMPFRRASSFILVTSDKSDHGPSPARLNAVISPNSSAPVALRVGNSVVEGLLEVIIDVFLDQVLHRKDFGGFGLFLKVPPGFQEHQAYFESYVLKHAMSTLSNNLRLNQKLLTDAKVLSNLTRYVTQTSEAVFEGWFLDGAEPLLDFIGQILEHLRRPEVASHKEVRISSPNIAQMRFHFLRITLLRLSELDETKDPKTVTTFLDKMIYWQTIMLTPADRNKEESTDFLFLRLMFYLLYIKFISPVQEVRLAAINFWRLVLVQKQHEALFVLSHAAPINHKHLPNAFMRLAELDNETFLDWTDRHREDLDLLFFGAMAKSWEEFVAQENASTEETARTRVDKRRARLRQWMDEERLNERTIHSHETGAPHWRSNIFSSERLRHQRTMQDQQESLSFTATTLNRFDRILKGPCALFEEDEEPKWRLDETEGPHRMRIRIVPDRSRRQEEYQPKRKTSDMVRKTPLKVDTVVKLASSKELVGTTPTVAAPPPSFLEPGRQRATSQSSNLSMPQDDEYEIIDDPKEDEDGFEDKNRKVMRALERGDMIQHVCNVSRIVGLEACEGLFILGKENLYLMDNYFQRADGEVVGVWQAPIEERDPYLQSLSGHDPKIRKPRLSITDQTSRHWRWEDVMVISKRRFLFRDVALEIFFADGRSYLLTANSPDLRNDLHARLLARAPYLNNPSSLAHSEDAWRLESWRNPEEVPQSIGSKFANVFTNVATNPATRRWMRGEFSNFHYLMLINTQAGRTFNDLTQYPVFPWVLADYQSEELDLTNPRTFRDFSKPMGCQIPGREDEFRERYKALSEMSGEMPFHYGTHYSSSMVVTSYLIRLQPFVQSYLSLQGGNFDHADRLFYSIEKAWRSASRDNSTDVRELTPEFFYLPEFLVNRNKYNFGYTQSTGIQVNDVILPPWAKGDPQIFIAKQREALESPYVSMHLHKWIDLIFGHKARGEAAIEAINVFTPLSYHGAKDLDRIEDPQERLSSINIIHNFGQTPYQVFTKPHPAREETSHRFKGLDNAAESLSGPLPISEMPDRIASLSWSTKHERLIAASPFRLYIPPTFDKYLEWGFCDASIRFFSTDSKKQLSMFEHLHIGPPSAAVFLDNRTLVTAGADCVLSIWNVDYANKTTNVIHRTGLFGHKHAITTLAASSHFMTLLSADTSGRVLMWDVNSNDFIRELEHQGEEVRCARISNATGEILLAKGRKIKVFTLNGDVLVEKDVCDEGSEIDEVTSCAWYENVKEEWMERIVLVTGHRCGVIKVWHKVIGKSGCWNLRLIKRLEPVGPEGSGVPVTALLPVGPILYSGDDNGKVYEWSCSKHD
ncbi:beach-domain-containing protein [Tothia fuscella]|uniref:Beige protein homolog 1 n=1 Tax=Tothia fuscella TaxID=1048955 RepID=A0A9P4TYK4_9PEZI|nr:beach-domain-containing protein [Tothia fuscella]